MQHQLIQRWDGFLAKIEERVAESLQHAEDACFEELREEYDYNTVFRSWQAMKSQIFDLIDKIDETWDNKVQPAMQAEGDFWRTERIKSGTVSDRLHYKISTFQRQLEGRLSQEYYNHVTQHTNKNLKCTQCHSPIQIKENVFREHYITCQYCQATNTYTPEGLYKRISVNIIDNIAYMNCQNLYQTMEKAINAINEQRPPVVETYWDNYKVAYYKYYEAFFKERIKFNADLKDRFEDDMKRKMKEYNDYEQIHKKSYKP